MQCGAPERSRDGIALLAIGVGDSDKTNAGNIRQHPGMIAAHDADADDADLQRFGRYPDNLTHAPKGSPSTPSPTALT